MTTVAEFKADLNRQRSMEGLTIAREQGRLRGKPPKLDERRTKKLLQEYEAGTATVAQRKVSRLVRQVGSGGLYEGLL